MMVRKATPKEIRVSCLRYHYARRVPSVFYGYSFFTSGGGTFIGTVCFGNGANMNAGKAFGLVQGEFLELVRVALNGKQGHGNTSKVVAMALRELHREVPTCRLVVSYSDSDQDHLGIIYQATNWTYVGHTNAGDRCAFVVHGERLHPRTIHSNGWKESLPWLREHVDPNAKMLITKGKHKYLYPMDRRMRKQIAPLALPYPKRG